METCPRLESDTRSDMTDCALDALRRDGAVSRLDLENYGFTDRQIAAHADAALAAARRAWQREGCKRTREGVPRAGMDSPAPSAPPRPEGPGDSPVTYLAGPGGAAIPARFGRPGR